MNKRTKLSLIIFAVLVQLLCPCMAFATDDAAYEEPTVASGAAEEGTSEALGAIDDANQSDDASQTDAANQEEVGEDELLPEETAESPSTDAEDVSASSGDAVGEPVDGAGIPANDEPAPSDEPTGGQAHAGVDDQTTHQDPADQEEHPSEEQEKTTPMPETDAAPETPSPTPPAEETSETTVAGPEEELAARFRDVINDGVYEIESLLKKGLLLDLHKSSEDNYVNVEVKNRSNDLRQRWYVEHDESGFISFYNMVTGKALDLYGGNAKPRENVQQYRPNGTRAQKWVAVPSTERDGAFQIVSALDAGLALDVYDGRSKSGTNVWVYRDNGTPAQLFSFLPQTTVAKQERSIDDGFYTVSTLVDDAFALDTSGASSSGLVNAQVGVKSDSNTQLFHVSYTDGYYRIQNVQSEQYLDAQGNGLLPRTNACQSKRNASASQEWSIVQKDDSYCIVNRANGLALDVYDGKASKGANVWLYRSNNTKAQSWRFDPYVPLRDGECYAITSCKDASYGVEVHGETTQDGANVQLSKYAGAFPEKWIAHRNEDGSYSFESLASGHYLGTDGGNVCQQRGEDGQIKWRLEPTKKGFNFVSVVTGLLMDINGGRMVEGTNIKLWKSNGGAAQRFLVSVVPILEERTYTVRLAGTNELVDVRSGRKDAGTAIQLFHDNGSNAQMWTAINNYDGITSLVSERSGLAMSWGTDGVVQDFAGGGKSLQHRWFVSPNGDGTFALVATDGSDLVLSAESDQDRATTLMGEKGSYQHQSFVFAEASPREGNRTIDDVKSLSFSDGNALLIERGSQVRLAVDISPRLAKQGEIVFSSANSSVVEVSDDGTIIGLRPGTTTITARLSGNSKSAVSCEVTVSETKGQITSEMLEMIARSDCNELMVVAHPDDETFWGGAHLIEGNYLVICLTNGFNTVRRQEFRKAMDISGSQRIILSYPDTNANDARDQWTHCKEGLLKDLLAVLSVKHWDTVATHNRNGDTGHIHHKMTNALVTQACQKAREAIGAYYNFGTFYKAGDPRIDEVTPNVTGELLEKKLKMVACYPAEQVPYKKYWAQMMPHEHWEAMTL